MSEIGWKFLAYHTDGSAAYHTDDREVYLTQQPITRMIVPSRGDQENPPCLDLFRLSVVRYTMSSRMHNGLIIIFVLPSTFNVYVFVSF